eukprot:3110662-Amphidinium_carterae.2
MPLATHRPTKVTHNQAPCSCTQTTPRLPKLAERGATDPPEIQPQHCPSKTPYPPQPQVCQDIAPRLPKQAAMQGVLNQYGHPAHTHPGVRRLRTVTKHEGGAPSSSLRQRTNLPFKRR